MKVQVALGALLVAALGGNAYLLNKQGGYDQVELSADVPAEAVELKTADKDVFIAEADNAGAKAEIKCSFGVISNYPDRCYCQDGGTAGWFTDASECKAEVTIADGKVYVRDVAAEAGEVAK